MRGVLFMAALATVLLIDTRASQALYEGPWCAVQSIGEGTAIYNCRMRTFEECRLEVIAGNRGHCVQNARWPGWYNGTGDQLPPARKRRVR